MSIAHYNMNKLLGNKILSLAKYRAKEFLEKILQAHSTMFVNLLLIFT